MYHHNYHYVLTPLPSTFILAPGKQYLNLGGFHMKKLILLTFSFFLFNLSAVESAQSAWTQYEAECDASIKRGLDIVNKNKFKWRNPNTWFSYVAVPSSEQEIEDLHNAYAALDLSLVNVLDYTLCTMLLIKSPRSIENVSADVRALIFAQEISKTSTEKGLPDVTPTSNQCAALRRVFITALAEAKRTKDEEAQQKSQEDVNAIFALLNRCPQVQHESQSSTN